MDISDNIIGHTDLIIHGDISGHSHLDISENITGHTDLIIHGDISGHSTMDISDNITGHSMLIMDGDISANNNLNVGNDVFIQNRLQVGGIMDVHNNKITFPAGTHVKIQGTFTPPSTISSSQTLGEIIVTGTGSFGDIETGKIRITSDYRLKKNVVELDDQFVVDNLRPVHYDMDERPNEIGLIAHELQDHYPSLVSGTKDGEEIQSVNYIGIIGILIKEVQNLKKIVQIQGEEIEKLKLDSK